MSTQTVPEGVQVVTVSALSQQLKGLLEKSFAGVWVSGEVSKLARPTSGHLYFNLKDAQAVLRGVVWRAKAARLRFELRDGMEVIVRGKLTLYAPQGNYQLDIDEIQPKGIGALDLAFQQLKEKLFLKGYFDPRRKRPLPKQPRRLALVTSPTGAAVRDMLEILGRRWPLTEVWICGVRVQGDGAAAEIAAMIRQLNALRRSVDVMIVGRGGGSLEDLWAFNEEIVAQAIFESRIPVISAVGHEVDVTIADLVADKRAATPSEGAEVAVPNRQEMYEGLLATERRLKDLLLGRLKFARQRWQDLAARRAFRLPLERLRELERRLDDWEERLRRAVKHKLHRCGQTLEAHAGRLASLSPLNVLARGYSLTRDEQNQVIRGPEQVRPGQRLVTMLQHGSIVSRVEASTPTAAENAPGELF